MCGSWRRRTAKWPGWRSRNIRSRFSPARLDWWRPDMPATERKITPADILAYEKYAADRAEFRKNVVAVKQSRRVEVGPFASFYFENYDTMWLQVQEMLHIEKGGAAQIPDELDAYNPLIPQGSELIATLMLELVAVQIHAGADRQIQRPVCRADARRRPSRLQPHGGGDARRSPRAGEGLGIASADCKQGVSSG